MIQTLILKIDPGLDLTIVCSDRKKVNLWNSRNRLVMSGVGDGTVLEILKDRMLNLFGNHSRTTVVIQELSGTIDVSFSF